MIRRLVAVAIWFTTVLMDGLMTRALATGGLLDQKAAEQGTVSEVDFAVAYMAFALIVSVTLAYATVGMILATRSGAGRIGTILLAGGLMFAAIPFGYVVGGSLVLRQPFDPFANAVYLLGPTSIAIGYSLILPVVALAFPYGALPSPRWRWPTGIVVALLVAATMITGVRPGEIADSPSRNPFGLEGLPSVISDIGGALTGMSILAMTLLGTAAVVVRYRRGSHVERLQLRWFVTAVSLAAVPLAISPQPGIGGPAWVLIAAVGLLLVPVSLWIAVTRYRLYEIDRFLSRGLAWGLLTGLMVAVYAVGALILQSLLEGVTQGETLAVAASTLLAATLFQPVRRRLQQAMDHRFDRARYDADHVVAGFSERLRDVIDLETLSAEIRRVADATVRPSTTTVWLRSGVAEAGE